MTLPAAPQRSDGPTVFADKGDLFMAALPTFESDMNAVNANVTANKALSDQAVLDAQAQASAAANSASAATSAAAAAGAVAWVSGTTYTIGDAKYSPLDYLTYRRKTNGAGTIDPSLDGTNWALMSGTATLSSAQTLTNKTLSAATNTVEAVGLKSATTIVSVSAAAAPTSGQVLTATGGSTATWQTPNPQALVLLAVLTPTAAANLDFLNVFSSTYDNYLIIGQGIRFDSNASPYIRFANAGVVDSGALYSVHPDEITTGSANTGVGFGSSVLSGGMGSNFSISIQNANSTVGLKSGFMRSEAETLSGQYRAITESFSYKGANAVSGFRLSPGGGGNFAATGSIRVYGYANT